MNLKASRVCIGRAHVCALSLGIWVVSCVSSHGDIHSANAEQDKNCAARPNGTPSQLGFVAGIFRLIGDDAAQFQVACRDSLLKETSRVTCGHLVQEPNFIPARSKLERVVGYLSASGKIETIAFFVERDRELDGKASLLPVLLAQLGVNVQQDFCASKPDGVWCSPIENAESPFGAIGFRWIFDSGSVQLYQFLERDVVSFRIFDKNGS